MDINVKKAGFVAIIGRSNVGKSTLINALVGSKVAITSPKAQTTRMPIQGILTTDEGQAVFVDTPGILQKGDDLTRRLVNILRKSIGDVDAVLYVIDPTRAIGPEEKKLLSMIKNVKARKILVINKIDEKRKDFLDFYRDMAPEFDAMVEVSAWRGTNIKQLIKVIFENLPVGEQMFPTGQLTTASDDFLIAEIIREKLFLRLKEEVPYALHVEIDEIDLRENDVLYIAGRILVSDERYKGIVIGLGGRGLREIGQSSRRELEAITGKRVYLDLEVAVDKHWAERFE